MSRGPIYMDCVGPRLIVCHKDCRWEISEANSYRCVFELLAQQTLSMSGGQRAKLESPLLCYVLGD